MTFNKTLTLAFSLAVAAGACTARADPVATEPATDHGAFLAGNAAAPDVVTLPRPQYKVLKSGPADGAHPTQADTIIGRY